MEFRCKISPFLADSCLFVVCSPGREREAREERGSIKKKVEEGEGRGRREKAGVERK